MTRITEPLFDDDEADRPVACQNCDWTGVAADAQPIHDLEARVSAGETVPVGECPKCGALCHWKEGE